MRGKPFLSQHRESPQKPIQSSHPSLRVRSSSLYRTNYDAKAEVWAATLSTTEVGKSVAEAELEPRTEADRAGTVGEAGAGVCDSTAADTTDAVGVASASLVDVTTSDADSDRGRPFEAANTLALVGTGTASVLSVAGATAILPIPAALVVGTAGILSALSVGRGGATRELKTETTEVGTAKVDDDWDIVCANREMGAALGMTPFTRSVGMAAEGAGAVPVGRGAEILLVGTAEEARAGDATMLAVGMISVGTAGAEGAAGASS